MKFVCLLFALPALAQNSAFLQVSREFIAFSYQAAQKIPPPEAVVVTSSDQSGLGATIKTATANGGNWLVASDTSIQTPTAFHVSVASGIVAVLAPGSYFGTITVAQTNSVVTLTITVTLHVASHSVLSVSTAPVIFNAQAGGAEPLPQTRLISPSGNVPLPTRAVIEATTSSGGRWLTATVNFPIGDFIIAATDLSISVMAVGLNPGRYTGAVKITSGGALLEIPVVLTVATVPVLSVNRSLLTLTSNETAVIQLGSSSGSLPFVASSSANWFSVTPTGGTAPAALSVTVNPAFTGGGVYAGFVMLRSQGGGSDIRIPVILTVAEVALHLTADTASFVHLLGQPLPPPRQIEVIGPLSFTVTQPAVNWASVTTRGRIVEVSLTNAVNSLPLGNHTSNFMVSGGGRSVTVTVLLSIASLPGLGLGVSQGILNLSAHAGVPDSTRQTIQVSGPGLAITAVGDASWLAVTPNSGVTPISLSVGVNARNLAPGNVSTRLVITAIGTNQTVVIPVVVRVEAPPPPLIIAITNSATYLPSSLAPGMLVTILGSNLGPSPGVPGEITGGRFTTSLVGVRVLFDGIAAPILFASATQINTVVPYQMAGRSSARMSVQYGPSISPAITPRLNDASPGIFTTDGRQAAALNEDGSVNSPSNPASAGRFVVLYLTGEGPTIPAGADGELVSATNLKKPIGAVRVRVNGIEVPSADIAYAGSAPGMIAGLVQINVRLPGSLPSHPATPVEVLIGGVSSPAGVTIAVR